MDYDLFVSRMALLALQLLQKLGRLLITASMNAEKSQNETVFELACGGVDAGVEGKSLIVPVVPQTETGIGL